MKLSFSGWIFSGMIVILLFIFIILKINHKTEDIKVEVTFMNGDKELINMKKDSFKPWSFSEGCLSDGQGTKLCYVRSYKIK